MAGRAERSVVSGLDRGAPAGSADGAGATDARYTRRVRRTGCGDGDPGRSGLP